MATIEGYAVVWGAVSDDLAPGRRERFGAGAFSADSLRNVRVVGIDHDTSETLAATWDGTLDLEIDARGLRYSFEVAGDEARRVAEEISAGRCRGSSLSFSLGSGYWSSTGDVRLFTVCTATLGHISPCTAPAYPQTHVRVKDQPARSTFVSTPAAAAARRQYEQTAARLELDKLARAHPRDVLEVRDCA